MTLYLKIIAKKSRSAARLQAPGLTAPAQIGRSGPVEELQKKEGDGTTPLGTYGLRTVFFRPDRIAKPETMLPVVALSPDLLWCDDLAHGLYNRPVHAPFPANHEQMWRDDRCYDLCVVLSHNLDAPKPGLGSAVFFHLTNRDIEPGPTEGCVAVDPQTMLEVLLAASPGAQMTISLEGEAP